MDPKQRKKAAQTNARDTIGNIDLNKGFLPGRTRCTEYIAPVEEKCPGYADHKSEKLGNQKIKAGKQAK